MAKVLEQPQMDNQTSSSMGIKPDDAMQAAMMNADRQRRENEEEEESTLPLERAHQAVVNTVKEHPGAVIGATTGMMVGGPVMAPVLGATGATVQHVVEHSIQTDKDKRETAEMLGDLKQDDHAVEKTYSSTIAQLCNGIAGIVGRKSVFGTSMMELADHFEFQETGHEGISKALNTEPGLIAAATGAAAGGVSAATAAAEKASGTAVEASDSVRVEPAAPSAEVHRDAVDFVASGKVEEWASAKRFDDVVRNEELRLKTDNAQMQANMDMQMWNPNASAEDKAHAADPLMQHMFDLKQFNEDAKSAIDIKYVNDPEGHDRSMKGLKKYMVVNVQDGYDRIYKADVSEHVISDGMKMQLNNLRFDGVSQNYNQFSANMDADGKDVQYAREREARIDLYAKENKGLAMELKAGTPNPILDDIKNNMSANGRAMVENDAFLNLSDPKNRYFKVLDGQLSIMARNMSLEMHGNLAGVDVTDAQRYAEGEKYVNMMEGVESFNESALKGIEEKYANDPEKLAQAQKGLENVMQHMVGNGMAQMYMADKVQHVFSDDMKAHLDTMRFDGMAMTFSDYVDIREAEINRGHNQRTVATENTTAFEDAYEAAIANSGISAEPLSQRGVKMDKGAEAENRFGYILQQDEHSKSIGFGMGE